MMEEITYGKNHPAMDNALDWLKYNILNNEKKYEKLLTLFFLEGKKGNRLAQICGGTLRRLIQGVPVGERYVLGLAWTIIKMDFEI